MRCSASPSLLRGVARRGFVSRATEAPARMERDNFSTMAERLAGRRLGSNMTGAVYREQQPLWPSEEAMEADMTRAVFAPAERLPPQRLPAPVAELQLEDSAGEESALLPVSPAMTNAEAAVAADAAAVDATMQQRRDALAADLRSNEASRVAWATLGLDPAVASLATERLGPTATRVQSRLLPALLDEAHKDVVLSGATGSGKTAALVLAVLHAVRTESTGMNIIVCANDTLAQRAFDLTHALCGEAGGLVADRAQDDMDWLQVAPEPEHAARYFRDLRSSLKHPAGGCRALVTTAPALCELLYESKLQFEDFGFLRRLYIDDAAPQVDLLPETATLKEHRDRLARPTAAQSLLATLHQLPQPTVRSLMQIGCVSADVDSALAAHLKALCVKPEAHTMALVTQRLPSTLHCVFSFHTMHDERWAYVVRLLRNAAPTMPGRCAVFVRKEEDLLTVRDTLRRLGVDAKLLFEVLRPGEGFAPSGWRFVLLREEEAFGLDIPLLSHVVVTFCPASRHSLQHMAGRAARLGAPGWVYVVEDQRHARSVRRVASELDVDMVQHCITDDLRTVPADVAHGWSKEPVAWGLDPQAVVAKSYERFEDPVKSPEDRGDIWGRNAERDFIREDYTPVEVLHRRQQNALKLSRDIRRAPHVVEQLQRRGLLTKHLKPTAELRRQLEQPQPRRK